MTTHELHPSRSSAPSSLNRSNEHALRSATREARRSSPASLACSWLLSLQWQRLLYFVGDFGRDLIRSGYDPSIVDRAAAGVAAGRFWPSRLVDWLLLQRDTHLGMRQRHAVVVEALCAAALERRQACVAGVKIRSHPLGLGRDLRAAWRALEDVGTRPEEWLTLEGVYDERDEPYALEARSLAEQERLPLRLVDASARSDRERLDRKAQVYVAIDLSRSLDPEGLAHRVVELHQQIEPGGWLVMDLFRPHRGTIFSEAIGEKIWTHPDEAFEAMLGVAGYELSAKLQTLNGVIVVYCARRPSSA